MSGNESWTSGSDWDVSPNKPATKSSKKQITAEVKNFESVPKVKSTADGEGIKTADATELMTKIAKKLELSDKQCPESDSLLTKSTQRKCPDLSKPAIQEPVIEQGRIHRISFFHLFD